MPYWPPLPRTPLQKRNMINLTTSPDENLRIFHRVIGWNPFDFRDITNAKKYIRYKNSETKCKDERETCELIYYDPKGDHQQHDQKWGPCFPQRENQ